MLFFALKNRNKNVYLEAIFDIKMLFRPRKVLRRKKKLQMKKTFDNLELTVYLKSRNDILWTGSASYARIPRDSTKLMFFFRTSKKMANFVNCDFISVSLYERNTHLILVEMDWLGLPSFKKTYFKDHPKHSELAELCGFDNSCIVVCTSEPSKRMHRSAEVEFDLLMRVADSFSIDNLDNLFELFGVFTINAMDATDIFSRSLQT